MNCSAEKASRKWASGAFGRNQAAMVTVAAVLLLLGAQAGPVHAARSVRPAPWGDLLGAGPPRGETRPRGSVHRAAVPLPRPRPADAPAAETETGTGPAAVEPQPQAPQAGKQLFDRRKKRLRREWAATLTNILYIKIPVIDPDRLLTWMLPWLWGSLGVGWGTLGWGPLGEAM